MVEPSWIGMRVTVRRALGRDPAGRLQFGDVVGDLVELHDQLAVIDTRSGLVEVSREHIAVAKLAPPSTRDELELEAILARGWRATDTDQLGGWLLRATDGFTGRANSVLPLGQPGMSLDAALDAVSSWYARRGLPARFQVPTESRRLLDAALGDRGWAPSVDVHVMTSRIDLALRRPAAEAHASVELAATPDDAWFGRYRDGAGNAPPARALLTRHDQVCFAAVRTAGEVVAIGRATIDDGWLGVTAVEVAREHRRAGLATAVMRSVWAWGAARGAVRSHLQVSADNAAALGLYERLGYRVHHDYRYRDEPPTSSAGAAEPSA